MTPYRDPNILTQALYILLGFIGASISIVYGLIVGKKYTLLKSLGMIMIGGFVGWGAGVLTGNTLISSFSGVISLEIIHMVKEYGPELVKEKIKNIFKIK